MDGSVKFILGSHPGEASSAAPSQSIPESQLKAAIERPTALEIVPSTKDEENHETAAEDEDINPFAHIMPNPTSRVKQVWAVGGGKGGVGKSLIASSLAISLSRLGTKVVAIDLDLGGANLHTTLGVEMPKQTLSDFFANRVQSLDRCISPTGIPNLEIISGALDAVGIANIRSPLKIQLLQRLREIDADYLILDLGAGTNLNTIDFFLYADVGVVALLPEPTSIENAYRFIKSAYYRRLKLSRNLGPVKNLIETAMDAKNPYSIKSPADLYREVNKISPESGMKLKEEIERFKPKLLVNQARTQTDVDIGFSVKTVCRKYFGIDMDYVGYLDYDSAVWQAVRRKRPLVLEFPNSRLVSSLDRIVQYIIKRHGQTKTDLY